MIKELLHIKQILPKLVIQKMGTKEMESMYIDYHKPYVSRVWFKHENLRIFLHKIEPCNDAVEALYHPHKWDSAMEIIKGKYEMGIGHSSTNDIPKTDCKLILPAGTIYEMTEKDGWHYVNPIGEPCYTLMVTGPLNGREMPIEPSKPFRTLTETEIKDILDICCLNDFNAKLDNVLKQTDELIKKLNNHTN